MKMDPKTRIRIKLEKLLRVQNRKIEVALQGINLFNLESLCCYSLCKHYPTLYSSVSSLKEKGIFIKRKFDELGLDDYSSNSHTSLSCYNRIIKDIPEKMVYNIPKNFIECQHRKKKGSKRFSKQMQKQNVNLLKHMNEKMEFLLDGNLLNYYVTHIIRDCPQRKWRISKDVSVAEAQIERFLKVCDFFPPKFEISPSDSNSCYHYSLFANLLKFCHNLDLQNSEIVMKILKIILKMLPVNSANLPSNIQPTFSKELLRYILFQACKTKTDLQFCISNYYNTIWNFSRNFSVLESVANGDEDFVFLLLNAGFEIFPEEEQEEVRHKFPNISDVIPKDHKMILFVMEKIRSNSLWTKDETIAINEEQKKCFYRFGRYIMTTYATKRDLYRSISAEYASLLANGIDEESCLDRKRRLRRLAKLYADNFIEMVEEAKEPRSLKDLSLISLRKSFRNAQKHTTAALSTVRDMYQDFTFFEDEDFRQPFQN